MATGNKFFSRRWTAVALTLLVALGAVAPSAQERGKQGPRRRADRVDVQLAERLDQGDGSDAERVIITLKPGAKRRIDRKSVV